MSHSAPDPIHYPVEYKRDKEKKRLEKIGHRVEMLQKHPNYKDQIPYQGETIVQFTLRQIAHLISPPMEDKESNEVECVDVAKAVLGMEEIIMKQWATVNKVG